MEPEGGWSEYEMTSCTQQQQHAHDNVQAHTHSHYHSHADIMKPLIRRRLQHQRDLAHSLVGTPNYIAPEVLARTGQYCHFANVCVLMCTVGDCYALMIDVM